MKHGTNIVRFIFSLTFSSAYISFSLLTLQNCNSNQEKSTSDRIRDEKQRVTAFMCRDFNAELFSCNTSSILKKTTVLDTLILGVSKQGKDYFLKACVITPCSEKYYAKLKCNFYLAEKFGKTKSNRAILAARVERIDNINIAALTDSLDGKITELNLGKSILLSGVCLELTELSTTLN